MRERYDESLLLAYTICEVIVDPEGWSTCNNQETVFKFLSHFSEHDLK